MLHPLRPLRRSHSFNKLRRLEYFPIPKQHATTEFHGRPSGPAIVPPHVASAKAPAAAPALASTPGSQTKTMHNRCGSVRVECGDKVVRCLSFFAQHPSSIPEEMWRPHSINGELVLIDTCTSGIMGSCECQLLVDPNDVSAEPTIVAVEIRPCSTSSDQMDKMCDEMDNLEAILKNVNLQ